MKVLALLFGLSTATAGLQAAPPEQFNARDEIQFARGHLPEGDGRLFSETSSAEMWKPVVLTPIATLPDPLKPTQPMFDSYALGWSVRDYRGAKIVWHSGGVFGFVSAVVLIPEKNVGFSILTNVEQSHLVRGLMFELLDHYLGLPTAAWPEKWAAVTSSRIAAAVSTLTAQQAVPLKAGPSLAMARYAGNYADPWHGRIAIRPNADMLPIYFHSTPRMTGQLEHWQYDTFVTRFDDKAIEPAYVTFGLDSNGKVERITMKAVSPIADLTWDYHDLLFSPVGASK